MPLQHRPPVGPKPEMKKWRKTPRFLNICLEEAAGIYMNFKQILHDLHIP